MKRKAARYLVNNIQYHQSFVLDSYSDYCLTIDSLYLMNLDDSSLRVEADHVMKKYAGKVKLKYDTEILTEEYLIDHIDDAFRRWNTEEYLQHLNFEEFCEYVLPYKCVEGQMIDDWKKYTRIDWTKDSLIWNQTTLFENSVRHGYMRVHDYIYEHTKIRSNIIHLDIIPILHPKVLLNAPYADCYEKAILELMYCQANGLPAVIDYVPNWMDRSGVHYWINILNTARVNEAFEPLDPNNVYPGYFRKNDYRMPKVYRFSWKPRKILKKAYDEKVSLPRSMDYIFTRDVTQEYCRVVDIKLKTKSKQRYLYLSVFDNNDWVPIDIAINRNGNVKFSNIGIGGTYCLVEYRAGEIRQVAPPFELSLKGEIVYYPTEFQEKQNVRMSRKFPMSADMYGIRSFLTKGTLCGTNSLTSESFNKLCEFPESLSGDMYIGEEYRYFSLSSENDVVSDFAELYFFDDNGNRLYPQIIKTSEHIAQHVDVERLFDDNPLTYFRIGCGTGCDSVLFDFGSIVSIRNLVYCRRGDGNNVLPGDQYELYYNTGDGWQLHDRVISNGVFVDFEDVPSGALLYLKCMNRGIQNRIFTYQDKIYWR